MSHVSFKINLRTLEIDFPYLRYKNVQIKKFLGWLAVIYILLWKCPGFNLKYWTISKGNW